MAKSSRPTGLAMSRKGNTFTATWKIPSGGYGDGQQMQYRTNGNWANVSIGKTTKSKALTIAASNFYPYSGKKTVTNIQFRVRGNRSKYTTGSGRKRKTVNPSMSDWTTYTYALYAPSMPNVSQELGTWPKVTFSWTTPNSENTSRYWFTRTEYQSVLVQDSNITDGSKINWSSFLGQRWDTTGGASGSLAVTDDSSQLNDGHSYTRWFRIRAVGPRGASNWRYSRHVYAMPNQCTITDYRITPSESAQGYTVQVWFNSPIAESRPMSQVVTEYALATPDAGMVCPDGASWTEGSVGLAKDSTGGAVFSVDSLVGTDQCLFVRVNSVYDERTTYGAPKILDIGRLATPSALSVQTDSTTYMATVTATNESDVPDSFLMIRYYTADEPDGIDIGVIPHGQTQAIIQCPQWTTAPVFGVYAVAPADAYTSVTVEGVTQYTVDEGAMTSLVYRLGGSVPVAPENVSAFPALTSGTVRVTWDWTWSEADSAELSWADHEDAWESTDQPKTYTISKMRASAWNISNLETGITWYIRVRLISGTDSEQTYGAYSETVTVDLASAPLAPVLTLSDAVITQGGQVTASWIYSTTDGTAQAGAVVAEVIETEVEGETVTTYNEIAQVQTAQHVTLDATELGWQTGETHSFAVKVVSASGRESDSWSDPRTVAVADPPTCTITGTTLTTVTTETTDEEGQTVTDTVTALTELPLVVTVQGAGDSGVTRLAIERAAAYHVDRPDESDFNGYDKETVYQSLPITGNNTFSVGLSDLIGHLDDGASYRLVATVQDGLGQSAQATADFVVLWAHQPTAPTATVTIDKENMIAILSPVAPAGAAQTDVCDIYRLSADKPELIYEGATFGETYVDPFPTIGEYGGHRFVTRTATGDYITTDAENGESFAWIDTGEDEGDALNTRFNIIDFNSGRAMLEYNLGLSNQWQKDFTETKYLGGSIVGDWNPATSRKGTVSFTAVANKDADLIETMRRLAVDANICHVRTKEGSSFPADVEVNESYNSATGVKTYDYSLSITRVDQQDLDGMTLAEWQALHPEE